VHDALRSLLVAYLAAALEQGHATPSRDLYRFVRDGTRVTLEPVGQEPAPEHLLRDVHPETAAPDEFAALQGALTAALGSDAARVNVEAAASAMLRRHLEQHGRSVEREAVDESVAAFQAFVDHDAITLRLVGVLEDFQSDESTVRLADDVVLHPVTDDERQLIWRLRGETLQGIDHMAFGAVGRATHLLHAESEAERFADANPAPLQKRADDAITAMRLQRVGSVQATFQWFEVLPPVADYARALGSIVVGGVLFRPRIPARAEYSLGATDARELPLVLASLDAIPSARPALELALRRFNGAYARGPVEDRVIDVWVALEALFAPDATTELRFRASSRIARFLGEDQDDRVDMQRFLRLSYDVRSHFVHGGVPEAFEKKVADAGGFAGVADRTEGILRRALHQWIRDPQSPKTIVESLDAAMMG
jgi:hypothetical protein